MSIDTPIKLLGGIRISQMNEASSLDSSFIIPVVKVEDQKNNYYTTFNSFKSNLFGFNASGDLATYKDGAIFKLPAGSSGQVLSVSGGNLSWSSLPNYLVNNFSSNGQLLTQKLGEPFFLSAGVEGSYLKISSGEPTWVTDTFYQDPLSSTGQLAYRNGASTQALNPGSNGQFLKISGGIPAWETVSLYSDPLTQDGDLLYRNTSTTRLPVGTEGQVLKVSALGLPQWSTLDLYESPLNAFGSLIVKGIDGESEILPGSNGQILTISNGFPAWSNLNLSSLLINPTTNTGDIIANSGGVPSKISVGTNGQVLISINGYPTWQTLSFPIYTVSGVSPIIVTPIDNNFEVSHKTALQGTFGSQTQIPIITTDGYGHIIEVTNVDITSGNLTQSDDENVTLTLGGDPTSSLLKAVDLQLGWQGVLKAVRGGTGHGVYTVNDFLYANSPTTLARGTIGNGLELVAGVLRAKVANKIIFTGTDISHASTDVDVTAHAGGASIFVKAISYDTYGHITGYTTDILDNSLLDIAGDTNTGSVNLATESLLIEGGTRITTNAVNQKITINHGTQGSQALSGGSNTQIPVITADDLGHVISITNTNLDWNNLPHTHPASEITTGTFQNAAYTFSRNGNIALTIRRNTSFGNMLMLNHDGANIARFTSAEGYMQYFGLAGYGLTFHTNGVVGTPRLKIETNGDSYFSAKLYRNGDKFVVAEGNTVALTGDVTGSGAFDANGNISFATTATTSILDIISGSGEGTINLKTDDLTISGTSPIATAFNNTSKILTISHNDSGVAANSYGSASQSVSITVDAKGHITGISNNTIEAEPTAHDHPASDITSGTFASGNFIFQNNLTVESLSGNLVGADSNGLLTNITIGTGLSLSGSGVLSTVPSEEGGGFIAGEGDVNYLAKFTGSEAIGNSIMREASGKIGVGKSPVTHVFEVNGNIEGQTIHGLIAQSSANTIYNNAIFGDTTFGNTNRTRLYIQTVRGSTAQKVVRLQSELGDGTEGNIILNPDGGFIGIGIYPTQKFHLSGTALISTLAGTGTRVTTADSTGILGNATTITGDLAFTGNLFVGTTNRVIAQGNTITLLGGVTAGPTAFDSNGNIELTTVLQNIDLNFLGNENTGTPKVILNSQSFSVLGSEIIETSGNGATLTISHGTQGDAGSIGGSLNIPQISYDIYGHITNVDSFPIDLNDLNGVPESRELTFQGTEDRITISSPVTQNLSVNRTWTANIASTYAGQTSIVTLGTIATGTVPAPRVSSGTFGAGAYTFQAGVTMGALTATTGGFSGLVTLTRNNNSLTINRTTTTGAVSTFQSDGNNRGVLAVGADFFAVRSTEDNSLLFQTNGSTNRMIIQSDGNITMTGTLGLSGTRVSTGFFGTVNTNTLTVNTLSATATVLAGWATNTATSVNISTDGLSLTTTNTLALKIGTGLDFDNGNLVSTFNLTTAGTSGVATYNSSTGTLNIPNYANTTYTAGSGLTLTGTTFSLPIATTGSGSFVTAVTQTSNGLTVSYGTPTGTNLSIGSNTATVVRVDSSTGDNVPLPAATSTLAGIVVNGVQSFGGIKTFSEELRISGQIRGVVLGNSEFFFGNFNTPAGDFYGFSKPTQQQLAIQHSTGDVNIVQGGLKLAGTTRISNSGALTATTGNFTGTLTQDGTSAQWDINPYQRIRFGRSTNNASFRVEIHNGDNSNSPKILLNPKGNSYFNGGNLGIGTTSPEQILDLNAVNATYLRFARSNTSRAFIGVTDTTNGLITGSVANDLEIRSQGTKILMSVNSGSRSQYTILTTGEQQWSNTTQLTMLLTSEGDLHVRGDWVGYSTTITSDPLTKRNITQLEEKDIWSAINNINAYKFQYKDQDRFRYGLISTDVKPHLPHAINRIKDEFKRFGVSEYDGVDYEGLIPLAFAGIRLVRKEVKTEIQELRERVKELESKLEKHAIR